MDGVEEVLLFAIREDPDDDQARLVYADWLARTNPVRAELIVVQCEIERLGDHPARRDPLVRRERELLRLPEVRWPGWSQTSSFERGFWPAEQIAVAARDFIADPDWWFRYAPRARRLELADVHGRVAALVGLPALARYDELRLYTVTRPPNTVRLTADDHQRLAACEHLDGLIALDVMHGDLDDAGLLALARSPRFALARLAIGNNWRLSDAGVAALADPDVGHRGLIELDLGGLGLARHGVIDALARGWPDSLAVIRAGNCNFDGDAAAAVDALARRRGLAQLELPSNGLDPDHVGRLVRAPAAGSLIGLDLSGNRLRDDGAFALAGAPGLRGLERLVLRACSIGEAGAARLFTVGLPALVDLDLGGNSLGGALDALAGSSRRLVRLSLDDAELDEPALIRFLCSPAASELEQLDVSASSLDDDTARTLLDSPYLGKLRRLELSPRWISEPLLRELRARYGAWPV